MPLRVYDNNAWQSPTSIRIYNDSEWKTASVGYVYDMGMWRVVFPDPIIPVVNVIDNGSWAQVNTVNVFYVQMILNTSELESMVGELYSGTSATGTPLQTQTFNYEYILEGYEYYIRFYVSSPGTYTIKATATSITQNSVSVVSQPISPILLSVNITSANLTRSTYSVSWNSVGQEEYFVGVAQVGGSITILQQGSSTSIRSASGGISPNLLGNTQYDLYVGIRRSGEFMYTQTSIRLTTPPGYNPVITNFSATSTCNSITATWTNNADVNNGVISISEAVAFEQGMPIYGNTQNFNFSAPQNSRTFSNLLPLGYLNSATAGIYEISIYGRSIDNTQTETQYLYINTLAASISPPGNFIATSNNFGNRATFSWSAPTINCSTLNGYTIQYKLSSDTNWSLVSNTIPSNTTFFDPGATLTLTPNTSYDFRIFARGEPNNSTYSYSTITTNNAPHNIFLYTLPLSTTTFTVVSVIAQLRNINNQSVTNSGITVNFSASPSGRGTLSSTSATTGSNGQATVTFTPNATTGDITLSATSSGLVSGSWNLGVALSPGLTPSLSTARTNFGYDITVNNYDSSYTWGGSVTNGGFNFNGNWQTNFYTIVVPPINLVSPTASQTSTQVTCTQGTWNMNPTAQTTVTTNKTGYSQGSASVSNSPTGSITATDYTWYFNDGTIWGTGQTRNIGSLVRGRTIRCLVTVTRTGGNQASAFSNFITVPA